MTTTYKTNVTSTEEAEQLTFHINVNYPTCEVDFDLTKAESLLFISTPSKEFRKKDITELIRCLGYEAEQTSMGIAV